MKYTVLALTLVASCTAGIFETLKFYPDYSNQGYPRYNGPRYYSPYLDGYY
jgi:hypothetical protein